jgi:hypothetical protein
MARWQALNGYECTSSHTELDNDYEIVTVEISNRKLSALVQFSVHSKDLQIDQGHKVVSQPHLHEHPP